MFDPPITSPNDAALALQQTGAAVLSADGLAVICGVQATDWCQLAPSWEHLQPDQHLKDGGKYRKRRHSCFILDASGVQQTPHRAHWQPVEYNALHGGIERWFDPMDAATLALPVWQKLLIGLCGAADAVVDAREAPPAASKRRWHIEAHQFRIDTEGGIGRPTPEGAHRDGVDLVVVALVGRHRVKGGETRIFEADGPSGQRFTLVQPWTTVLLDDARMIHETTPIQPLQPTVHHQPGGQQMAQPGWRDTLVLTYRAAGFQGP